MEWQRLVNVLLDEAGFVVMFAGATNGLQWEIGQAFNRDPFVPTILLLPFFRLSDRFRENREAKAAFRKTFRRQTGLRLDDLESIGVVFFPQRDRPIQFRATSDAELKRLGGLFPYLPSLVEVAGVD